MLITKNNKINLVLRRAKNISKYLSPNIFIYKKKIILSCAIRYKKDKHYSEISGYLIDINNPKLKKKLFNIQPQKYFKSQKYYSFLSPFLFEYKNKIYCLIQASKFKKKKPKIILLKTTNLKKWYECKKKLFKTNKNLYAPCLITKKNRKYIFYSKDKNKIYCNIYTKNLNRIIKQILIYKIKKSKNIIYAPFVIKIKNKFLMFYSSWKDNFSGNIEILESKDLISWQKLKDILPSFSKKIKIISEPCVLKYKNYFLLFFEFKLKNYWNIGYTIINKFNI